MHIKKLGASAAYRRECGETVCDGRKLLSEAASHGIEIKTVLFCGEEPEGLVAADVCMTPRELIASASPMVTAQDVLFSCAIPEIGAEEDIAGSCIILENIQDPGNVGAMIRTANAFSIDTVALVGSCADPFSPKTIRASMGAVFRQKIVRTDIDGIKRLKNRGVAIYGAALSERSADIRGVSLENAAVVIGNEGGGLSEEMLGVCDGEIIIPMNADCESLNAGAAAAVIMWEMRRTKSYTG
ncbi:MAG: RNA methyltransferase [Oscillospiraceae bacterium]|nr:RNA methyltransferase [Oscillospiraceae bacterium]